MIVVVTKKRGVQKTFTTFNRFLYTDRLQRRQVICLVLEDLADPFVALSQGSCRTRMVLRTNVLSSLGFGLEDRRQFAESVKEA